MIKISLLFITFFVAIAGWLKPEKAPLWLQVSVVIAMVVALVIQIMIERKSMEEADELKRQIAEIHKSETARPLFELSVSGTVINDRNQLISLPEEKGGLVFELKLKNVGSDTARDVQAFLWAPQELNIPYLGKWWKFNGVPLKPGSTNNEKVVGVQEHVFISPAAINVGNWLTTGNGRLPIFRKGLEVPFRLKVYARGGVFQEWTFGIRQ